MPTFPTQHRNQLSHVSTSSLCLREHGVGGSHGGEDTFSRSLNHTDSFTILRHIDSRQTDFEGVPDCNGASPPRGTGVDNNRRPRRRKKPDTNDSSDNHVETENAYPTDAKMKAKQI